MRLARILWVAGAVLAAASVVSVTVMANSGSPGGGSDTQQIKESQPRGSAQPRVRAPLSGDEITRLLTENAEKPRFDGTVHGWRLAPDRTLEAEGLVERGLSRDCAATEASAEIRTDLDFTVAYLPANIKIADVVGPTKWICGGEGLSVQFSYRLDTPLGSGDLMVWRAKWGNRMLAAYAADGSVEEATISGHPAIVIHPAEDEYGLGTGVVIVIEDDAGPEYTLLTVSADNGVPFEELLKIAEGIR